MNFTSIIIIWSKLCHFNVGFSWNWKCTLYSTLKPPARMHDSRLIAINDCADTIIRISIRIARISNKNCFQLLLGALQANQNNHIFIIGKSNSQVVFAHSLGDNVWSSFIVRSEFCRNNWRSFSVIQTPSIDYHSVNCWCDKTHTFISHSIYS